MISIKELKDLTANQLNGLFNRMGEDFSSVMINTVIPIVSDVKKNGDSAVKKYTEKFDGVKLESVMVSDNEIEKGFKNTPDNVKNAFLKARDNIKDFHLHQKRENIQYTREDGTTLGIAFQPIERAAIYVPGGKASYPSSVLMGVVPAQIAGTGKITLITPPGKDGKVPDAVLAVCKILGIKSILKSGGAQGIAAAGFGTESIIKSDIIVGPGNIYVTAAKTYLFSLGIVQIDSMAGPSEILVIADESADPSWVAFDLLSQAEHDEMAQSIFITTSKNFAEKVNEEIAKDIESGSGRHDIKKKSITQNAHIFIADSLDEAIKFSNNYAPEHMELMVSEPLKYLDKIRNVGSLFLGTHSPVAVGDYYSGTNHILPTGGAARFSSGVSVETFLRRTTFQHLTRGALEKSRDAIRTMSAVEGFDDKHGGSVDIRFR